MNRLLKEFLHRPWKRRQETISFRLLWGIALAFFLAWPAASSAQKISENETAARQIVGEAIAAMGGTQALNQVRSLSMLGMTHVWVGDQELQGSAQYTYRRPDQYRVDVNLPALKIIQAFNGKVGWGMENLKDYPPEINQRIALSMQVALTRGLLALLNTGAPRTKMQVVSQEEVGSAKAVVIDFEDGAGNSTRFYFDRNTHLPLQAVYADVDAEGHPIMTTDAYFNFRKVGAVRWPHRMVEYQAGQRKREDIFTEIQVNGKIDKAFFNPVAP